MTTSEFKKYIKTSKEALRDKNITVVTKGGELQFNTLKSFGNYLLSTLTDTSHCSVIYEDMFMIMDESELTPIKKLTEQERQQGIKRQLQQWGTTE